MSLSFRSDQQLAFYGLVALAERVTSFGIHPIEPDSAGSLETWSIA